MYFANLGKDEIVSEILKRANNTLQDNYWDGLERNGKHYYGYDEYQSSDTSLKSSGDSGEFVKIQCNQARSLIRNTITLVASDRLAFECIALSNDESTFASTRVAKSILEDVVKGKP